MHRTWWTVLLVGSAVFAAGCNKPDPVLSQLEKLKGGSAFPGSQDLPEALRGKSWTARGVTKASSDLPMAEGGKYCHAFSTVLDAPDVELPQYVVGVFCDGKAVLQPDGSKFFATPIPEGKSAKIRSDVAFMDALEPGRVVAWTTERTMDEKSFLTIRERAWRVKNGRLAQILDVTTVDPSFARTRIPDGMAQAREANASYAPGFVGAHPKSLAVRLSHRGKPHVLKYDYTEAAGYRSPTPVPSVADAKTFAASPAAAVDGGTPDTAPDAGATP